MKHCMKISGGFHSERGANDFATLCNVLSTTRKWGLNRIEALLQGPAVLLTGLRCQRAYHARSVRLPATPVPRA